MTRVEPLPKYEKIYGRDPCVYCNGVANSIDHIEPKSKGGSKSDMQNWAPCCKKCNSNKGCDGVLLALLHPSLRRRVRNNRIDLERKYRPKSHNKGMIPHNSKRPECKRMNAKLKQDWRDWLKQGYRIGSEQRGWYTQEQTDWVKEQGESLWERFIKLRKSQRDKLTLRSIHSWIARWHSKSNAPEVH